MDRMTTPTLGSFLRERERERGARKWTSSRDSREGAGCSYTGDTVYRGLISDALERLTDTKKERGKCVYPRIGRMPPS